MANMEDIIDAQYEQGEQDIPSVEYDVEKNGDDSSIEEAEEQVEIILNRFKNKGKLININNMLNLSSSSS